MEGVFQCGIFEPTVFYTNCSTADTHDGVDADADVHRRYKDARKRRDKDFRESRQQLRADIERAWNETHPGPVAVEVKALTAPYVEQLESGAIRLDYVALRNAAVIERINAFHDKLQAEFDNEDDDVMLLLLS